MKKFASCKCFYEQNIFIKSWNCHVTFKNDQKFREEYQTSSGLEEALIEAKVEVERRINSRESWKARRDKIEQNYSPIFSEKLTHFIQDFDNSTIFEDGFKAGVHWASDRTTGSTIPTSSKSRVPPPSTFWLHWCPCLLVFEIGITYFINLYPILTWAKLINIIKWPSIIP